jgi:hypothetical protein
VVLITNNIVVVVVYTVCERRLVAPAVYLGVYKQPGVEDISRSAVCVYSGV